jgi:hypothetical protein
MTELTVGDKVNVRYTDQLKYILRVQVTEICLPDEFIACIGEVFADPSDGSGGGEIEKEADIRKLIGQKKKFNKADISALT